MDMKHEKRHMIVVGDRVLISPDEGDERTKVGLYLPQTVLDKDQVQGGRIMATGPGTPLPDPSDVDDEPWKSSASHGRHVPMQARVGDFAIFLRKASVEIKYEGKPYLVVPQSAILVLFRDQDEPLSGVQDDLREN
jgi:chaperonin GroES